MKQQLWSLGQRLFISSLLGLIWLAPVQAQQLRSAQVYRLSNNNVRLLLRNQPERQAKLGDRLAPADALRTLNATAKLLFNEGSLVFVNSNTVFRFRQGLRAQDLSTLCIKPAQLQDRENFAPACHPLVASTNLSQALDAPETTGESETILEVLEGVALVVVPPDGQVTTVETPSSQVEIEAQATAATPSEADNSSEASPLAASGNAALIVHQGGKTQVFALTDGLTVSDPSGTETVMPLGGQAVEATAAGVGEPFEFDLKEFYKTYPLAAGLGPGQESAVAQEPAEAQQTLNAVRVETLAAVDEQESRIGGFSTTFLREALSGADSDLYRGQPVEIQVTDSVDGIFTRISENTGTFTPTTGPTAGIPIPIELDFDAGTITIGGVTGTASSIGLSGNNASGTVFLEGGQIIRVEAFGVGGDEPDIDIPFPGRLTTGIAPDR